MASLGGSALPSRQPTPGRLNSAAGCLNIRTHYTDWRQVQAHKLALQPDFDPTTLLAKPNSRPLPLCRKHHVQRVDAHGRRTFPGSGAGQTGQGREVAVMAPWRQTAPTPAEAGTEAIHVDDETA